MSMRMTLSPDEERAVAAAYASSWWLFLVASVADLMSSFSYHSLEKELAA